MTLQAIPAAPGYFVLTCCLYDLDDVETDGIDPETHDLKSEIMRTPVAAWAVGDDGRTCHPVTPCRNAYVAPLPEDYFGVLCPDGQVIDTDGEPITNEDSFIERARSNWLWRLKRQREKEQANDQ